MIPIIFEDKNLVVLDKPAGITVNKSDTTKLEKTVQDLLEERYSIKANEDSSDFLKRAGLVHRIDKETSGILLAAKDEKSFLDLQRQFKERIVEKKYLALAHGKIIPEKGSINVSVGRLPWNRKKFGIIPGGRESYTEYQVLKYLSLKERGEVFSMVELSPKTGRTHQIRVHLKYINHPIFSDFLYAGRKTSRTDRKLLNRVFLHAAKIEFNHPVTGERLKFESKLPDNLSDFLKENFA